LSYFGARQLMGHMMRTRIGKGLKRKTITKAMRMLGPVPTGVEVQILKKGRTTLKRSSFLAEVAAGKSGSHVGVFRRKGKKRLPIEEKKVVSVATMVNRPEVMERVTEQIEERWAKEFPGQLKYYYDRAGK